MMKLVDLPAFAVIGEASDFNSMFLCDPYSSGRLRDGRTYNVLRGVCNLVFEINVEGSDQRLRFDVMPLVSAAIAELETPEDPERTPK